MNSVLTTLRRLFGRRISEPPHIRSALIFPQLDVEGLKSQLGLVEEGRKRGAHDSPTSDMDHYDDIEQKIISILESEAKKTTQSFEAHLDTYTQRINNLRHSTAHSHIRSPVDQAQAQFHASLNKELNELIQLQQNVRDNENDVDTFKREHDLDRAPHYPESRVKHWGLIGILLLIEAVLNGSFLALGNELGLLGGTFEAIVIALINVLLGLFVGWKVVTQWNHRSPYRKIPGSIGATVYLIGMSGFNLAVAHYRTALGGDVPEDAPRIAFETLTATPFLVDDIQSWLMFLLGCVFSVIAAIDGWMMDDPYPGYGRLARLRDEARKDLSEQRNLLFDELDTIRDKAIMEMGDALRGIQKERAEYQGIIDGRSSLESSFHQHMSHIEEAANHLLHSYRDANIKARKTEPPRHFSKKWKLERASHQRFQSDGAISSETPSIPDLVSQVQANSQTLLAAHARVVDECKHRLSEI